MSVIRFRSAKVATVVIAAFCDYNNFEVCNNGGHPVIMGDILYSPCQEGNNGERSYRGPALCAAGALVSFMISRLFYSSVSKKIQRHRKGLEYIARFSNRYGFRVILTARLLPFISFDFISYAAGLSAIKTRTFLLATGLGMLPATIVYTIFGFEMERIKAYSDRLFTLSVLAALVLFLIWTVQGIFRGTGRRRPGAGGINRPGPEDPPGV